jgi:dihydroflavonol-4-reductase
MANRTVLVTGADGFIARQLIVNLLGKGYCVRGTLRDPERAPALKATLSSYAPVGDLSFIAADPMQSAGWPDAMRGVDAVFYLASYDDIPDNLNPVRPALESVLRVLKTARDAGVTRIIVTSSVAAVVYGHGSKTRIDPFSESDWSNLHNGHVSAHHQAMTRAELAVWDFAMDYPDMDITTINPGEVFGPLLGEDAVISSSIVRDLLAGEYNNGLPRVGFEGVDVRDVAELHERALTNDLSIGNRYLCTAGFLWLRDVAEVLRGEFGDRAEKVPTRDLSDIAVRVGALFDRKASRTVPELGLYTPCSTAKACSDLGWQPQPALDAVRATAQSLIAANLV